MSKTNDIKMFFHCKDCLNDKPDDASPQEWSRLEVGWTVKGLQVWCIRHCHDVITLDFQGQKASTV